MRKILILATYPIKNPQHGGQKRTAALHKVYKQNFKQVYFSAVFFKGFYKDYNNTDIPLGPEGERAVESSPLTGDIVCGEAIYKDPKVKKSISKLLKSINPDIIHIEQPFPYIGLKPLLSELGMKPKLIFGSQNIEAPMKREILESVNADEDYINTTENLINSLEKELSRDSDLLVACTESDLLEHKKMGARNCVLAPNGINKEKSKRKVIENWKEEFKKEDIDKIALFVASAHPPSWIGFYQMVGKGLGYIPFNSRIVLAGSICDHFEATIKPESLDIQDATFWLRAYSAGRLSEDSLSALLEVSEVILLPITEGGGSNLKTAEAILADKKVVTTDHALRSFEWFKDFPNVWVANKQRDFQAAIIEAMKTPKIERSKDQKNKAESVKWEKRLATLVKRVGEV